MIQTFKLDNKYEPPYCAYIDKEGVNKRLGVFEDKPMGLWVETYEDPDVQVLIKYCQENNIRLIQ